MILSWMLSAALLGALLTLGGSCIGHFTPRLGLPRRWLWLAIMMLSTALPVTLAFRSRSTPSLPAAAISTSAPALNTALSASPASSAVSARPAGPAKYDSVLLLVWAATSLTLAVVFAASHRRTVLEIARWHRREMLGTTVTVSPDFGPAAVGLVHPDVVMPEWVFDLAPIEQRLALVHEQQHIAAGDHFVLLAGIAMTILMPWNVGLWWQLRRLRVSMELDCDARVAPTPRERPRYAQLLLRARNERQMHRMSLALLPAPSALGERLLELLAQTPPSPGRVASWSFVALMCAVAGSRVPVPDLTSLIRHPAETLEKAAATPPILPPISTATTLASPSQPVEGRAAAIGDGATMGLPGHDMRNIAPYHGPRYDSLIPIREGLAQNALAAKRLGTANRPSGGGRGCGAPGCSAARGVPSGIAPDSRTIGNEKDTLPIGAAASSASPAAHGGRGGAVRASPALSIDASKSKLIASPDSTQHPLY